MSVRFILNGKPMRIDDVDPQLSTLNWLRRVGLTGTKEGCSEGECGACAVAVVRRNAGGARCFEAINSCLVPLPALDGQTLITVEGVAGADGALHPVQQAMVERGGSQCGYCTPGFVVSLFCEYYRPGRTTFDPEAISGNLCRCTGYRPILDAGHALGRPGADDPWLTQLRGEATQAWAEPTAVDHAQDGRRFVRPTSLADVFRCLADNPDATIIAGGTDLMVRANQSYQQFGTLLSLEAVAELRELAGLGGAATGTEPLVIGAGVSLSELEDRLGAEPDLPILHELLRLFSSRLIRNRATLGGNLGTASPIGDSAPVLLALDAEVTLAGPDGTRVVPLRDFFRAYRQTALGPGELIVNVRLPRPFPRFQRFYKVSKRVLDDISTVAGAFALDLGPDGTVLALRLAYGGIGATPLVARAAAELAIGRSWTLETVEIVAEAMGALGTPIGDHRGSAGYRRAMIVSLWRRFFWETTAAPQADTQGLDGAAISR
jgi:xanthine dehydrogenase small subunit